MGGRKREKVEILETNKGRYQRCTSCKQLLPLNENYFYKEKIISTGFKSICIECKKEFYRENKKDKLGYQNEYAKKNKDYYSEYRKQYNKGGKENITVKKKTFDLIKDNNISIDGKINIDEREFTRLIGGFAQDKAIITPKQIATLLEYTNKDKVVNLTIKRNINAFEEGIDYIDIKKSVSDGNPVFNILKELGYTKQSLSNSKNIYILSESGFLLYLKFAEGERAIKIYKNFIEDYFKTKAENIILKETMTSMNETLEHEKKYLLGCILLENDVKKKAESLKRIEDINNQLKKIELTKKEEYILKSTQEKISEEYKQFIGTVDSMSWNNVAKNLNIGRNKLLKLLRANKIIQTDEYIYNGKKCFGENHNVPYAKYDKYFQVKFEVYGDKKQPVTKVKAIGQEFIYKKLKEWNKVS